MEAKKLIVVLGMHRSGTSAVTRGLQVMGVELGDRLIPAIEGNNSKGFWEDSDLNTLDVEMLAALDSDWFHLTPIEAKDVEALRNQGYFVRAVELLGQKVGGVAVFGFKDPRVAKLLPFWKEVFNHCNVNVNYILALRHPLSVVKSLAKRDGIAEGQSYLLWLGHVITALIGSTGDKRVLVDYDRLMQSPDAELMRISKCIDLEIDSEKLQIYKTEFLDQGLRHTVFEPTELLLDNACPPIVREIYDALLDVAADKVILDDQVLQRKVSHWSDEFERIKSPLTLIDRLFTQKRIATQAVTERDAQIASLSQAVTERDGQITALNRVMFERDEQIVSMNQAIVQRENRVSELEKVLSEQEHVIAAIRSSTSWRLTAPLRLLAGAIKNRIFSGNATVLVTLQPTLPSTAPSAGGESCVSHERESHDSPSFEALSGLYQGTDSTESRDDPTRLIAFYLPQYHRIPENSEWWGPGFTEWTNVVKGRPNYAGHYQPHMPRELGFYDLSSVEVMREQVELAKLYGVSAFCFYHYWFSGRRILERPVENFLRSDIDFPYCLCWANENWTRTWDGDTRSVLMEQKYLDKDPHAFITSLLPHFHDRRYLRVDGKPMLLVYRAKDIPSTKEVFRIWRDVVMAEGFVGLHIAAVDFYDITRPEEVNADALVEFPPHKFNGPQSTPDRPLTITNPDFKGGIVDYAKMMIQSANRQTPDFTLYRGILPSWDNTARRQNTSTVVHGSSPELFGTWLRYIRAYTRETFAQKSDPFVFVNAWNEWGEGCHLEPDQKWGLRYLDAIKASSTYCPEIDTVQMSYSRLLAVAAKSIANRDSDPMDSCTPVEQIREDLRSTKQLNGIVQKTAFFLRRFPHVHRLGKSVYQICFSLRRHKK